MFFSIIIPTYNPKQFLPIVLNSIIMNQCLNEIEIIISDDVSTEPFDDILQYYSNCNIKVIFNDKHYGFSRPGRENGMLAATGEWICFIDQDDYFKNGIFDIVKNDILTHHIHNYYATQLENETLNHQFQLMSDAWSLTHGKFYERTFLKQYNIHYPIVQYCEDANFQSNLLCTLVNNGLAETISDLVTYVWKTRIGSTSFCNAQFFFDSFPDYIQGEFTQFVDNYLLLHNANQDTINWYEQIIITQLISVYFNFQMLYIADFNFPVTELLFFQLMYQAINRFLSHHKITWDELYTLINTKYITIYNNLRNEFINADKILFIEHESIFDWLKNLPLKAKCLEESNT